MVGDWNNVAIGRPRPVSNAPWTTVPNGAPEQAAITTSGFAALTRSSCAVIEMSLALGEYEGEPCVRLVVPSRRGRHHFYQLNAAPLEALDLWLERYRMFWAHNLTNLKFFVEQEHARETGEIASNTRGNTPAKTRSKHK